MGQLKFDISVSLDGFIAGPDRTPDQGLGAGGEDLHRWFLDSKVFRESHGQSGGTDNPDAELLKEALSGGASIMGRGMFGGGEGPWGSDPAWGEQWNGWWGDDPPFHTPVFVLTHHEREPLTLADTTFTFVTDGIESALEQARAAAGDRDVRIGGGGNVAQQYLEAGLLDEMHIHFAPILLGGGTPLFNDVSDSAPGLEIVQTTESPAVTHVRYRVVK